MKKMQSGFILAAIVLLVSATAAFAQGPYAGSKKCADCHEDQYEQFHTYSKKAHSWESISIMASDLKPSELQECYKCHTTGYGDGGFVNYESTPQLSDVGCETCHGPGAAHVESEDPDDITRLPEIASCEKCHNSGRVESFKYKPLIYSGAH
ncbi:MAG: multiheme c-type cytochrome [Desulfovibrio sp.]